MQSNFNHLQLNIDFLKNIDFYKGLMQFLGWGVIYESDNAIGYRGSSKGDLWFINSKSTATQKYDDKGFNHLAIGAGKQSDIDECVAYLKQQGVATLFDTPRHRAEFTSSQDETYYQVMFESPDRILFEVVYVGRKT